MHSSASRGYILRLPGFTTYTCHCGDSYVHDYTTPLGHSFTNYVGDGNATCTQDGTKTAVCDHCEATDTRVDVGSAHGHDFSDWIVLEKPMVTAEGLESRTCYRCGLEETRAIVRLQNPFTDVPEVASIMPPSCGLSPMVLPTA